MFAALPVAFELDIVLGLRNRFKHTWCEPDRVGCFIHLSGFLEDADCFLRAAHIASLRDNFTTDMYQRFRFLSGNLQGVTISFRLPVLRVCCEVWCRFVEAQPL